MILFLIPDNCPVRSSSALNGALTHALMGMPTCALFLTPPDAAAVSEKLAACHGMGVRLVAVHAGDGACSQLSEHGVELLASEAAVELIGTARHCLSV